MNKIIMPRQMGKTTFLINLSQKTGKYILCLDKKRVENIWKMAIEMKVNIPFPITLEEIKDLHGSSINRDGVLVDDMDNIIDILISKAFNGIQIDTATFTDN